MKLTWHKTIIFIRKLYFIYFICACLCWYSKGCTTIFKHAEHYIKVLRLRLFTGEV